jgi:Ca2+-binding RTX toxin-like protein
LEQLETRCLLAAEFGPQVENGTLFLFLDAQNDVVNLQFPDSATAELTVNGAVYQYARNAIQFALITGGGGNDSIQADSTVDIPLSFDGEGGNDLLVGGADRDVLDGGVGNDTMLGGPGDDVISAVDGHLCNYDQWSNEICGPAPASQSQDSVAGGDGDDILFGDAVHDTLDGGLGANEIDTTVGDGGCVQVSTSYPVAQPSSYADSVFFQFLDAQTARVTVNSNSYDFELSSVQCFSASVDQGDDLIQVDDSVTVSVSLWGGAGNDTLTGGAGADYLDGGEGSDSLVGNGAGDTLSGGSGDDTIDGGVGNDPLDGGAGNDSAVGGAGDDTLAGGMGNDTLQGGSGNDIYIMNPGSDDVAVDDVGTNTLDFSLAGRGITLDLGEATGRRQVVDIVGNTVALRGTFQHLIGSSYADDITGSALANRIEGGGGDDTLDGGGGDRSLFRRIGEGLPDRRAGASCDGDTLVGGAGADWLDGGRGRDWLNGGDGADVLVGSAAFDVLLGGTGANQQIAVAKTPAGCPTIRAALSDPIETAVADRSRRGNRRDRTEAASVAEIIDFNAATGVLEVLGDVGGPRDDEIRITARTRTDAQRFARDSVIEVSINGVVTSSRPRGRNGSHALAGATSESIRSIRVRSGDGNDTIVVTGRFPTASGRITLDGGNGDDTLRMGSAGAVLLGGEGDDCLGGGRRGDTIVGGGGNDLLTGGGGDDSVNGEDGSDTLLGQSGDDTLVAGPGQDSLDGGSGRNELLDGPASFESATGRLAVVGDEDAPGASDSIELQLSAAGFVEVTVNGVLRSSDPASLSFDRSIAGATAANVQSILLEGRDGDDRLTVGEGFRAANWRTTVIGGAGDDMLQGSSSNEFFEGGPGDDSVLGGDGNDTMYGGDGADQLHGDSGADRLLGGPGSDALHGGPDPDVLMGGSDPDVIDVGDTRENGNAIRVDAEDDPGSLDEILAVSQVALTGLFEKSLPRIEPEVFALEHGLVFVGPADRGDRRFAFEAPLDLDYYGLSGRIDVVVAEGFHRIPAEELFPPALVATHLQESVPVIQLDHVRTQFAGLGGAGQTVAIIDSGLRDDVVDAFGGAFGTQGSRIVAQQDFSPANPPAPTGNTVEYNHGTNVAGIVAGATDFTAVSRLRPMSPF